MSEDQQRPAGRRRTAARLAAVQALYQIDLTGAPAETVIGEFRRHRLSGDTEEGVGYGEADAGLFEDIVRGAMMQTAEIDPLISNVLTPDWPLQRLEIILRAILRAGAWELRERLEVPARVTISEYLAIAHAFFTGKEPGMVNGVLDRLGRQLRAGEFAEGAGDSR
jgi:N utilization substance protein B